MADLSDPRERLLAQVIGAEAGIKHEPQNSYGKMPSKMLRVHLSGAEHDLLARAKTKRGFNTTDRGAPGKRTYQACAVLAFVAYDLGLNAMDLIGRAPLPEEPGLRQMAYNYSNDLRGQWGIVDLSDGTRGVF